MTRGRASTTGLKGTAILHGNAGERAASLEVEYSDGTTRAVALLEGYFLFELRHDADPRPIRLVARDDDGRVVDAQRLTLP
ncbi:MAG: hypothetical protein ABR583_00255 [Gaiellaceae bacterium]